MRNPWGHFSWTGAWSDSSDLWTPQLRDELMAQVCQKLNANSDLIWISSDDHVCNFMNLQGADDGVFWIAFEDVLTFFDCIDICKVSDIVKFGPNLGGGGGEVGWSEGVFL